MGSLKERVTQDLVTLFLHKTILLCALCEIEKFRNICLLLSCAQVEFFFPKKVENLVTMPLTLNDTDAN